MEAEARDNADEYDASHLEDEDICKHLGLDAHAMKFKMRFKKQRGRCCCPQTPRAVSLSLRASRRAKGVSVFPQGRKAQTLLGTRRSGSCHRRSSFSPVFGNAAL